MSREPRPPQLHHCADDSFKWIFMTENCYCDRSSTDAILTFSYKHLCFRQVFIFSCGPSSSINGPVCLSVCLSVRPSVRPSVTPFSRCSSHCIIMEISWIITSYESGGLQKVKVRSQRSRLQKSKQILSQHGPFQTVSPVWIQRWLRNDAQSLKGHRKGTLLFFIWAFPDDDSNLNSRKAMKWHS